MVLRGLALLACIGTALFAQTASITGRVTDPGGAVVPGATITVQSTASGVNATTNSNDEGYYSVPASPSCRSWAETRMLWRCWCLECGRRWA
jgi:hypothetical protein